jgi:amino acid transporter
VAGHSPLLATALAAIALFSTANTALLTLLGGSRMLFGMARGGDVPALLKQVLPGRQTPWVAAVAMLVIGALLLPLGSLEAVASVSSFAALVAFATVNVALIILRYRDPDRKRPFRVPLAIGRFPVLPALGALVSIPLLTQFDSGVYFVGAAIGVVGFGVFLGHRVWRKRQD